MKSILGSVLFSSVGFLLIGCGSISGDKNSETMDIYKDHTASLVSKHSLSNNVVELEDGRPCSLKITKGNGNSLKFEFNYFALGKNPSKNESIDVKEFEETNLDGQAVSLMRVSDFIINERTHQVFVGRDGRVTRYSIYGLNTVADCRM